MTLDDFSPACIGAASTIASAQLDALPAMAPRLRDAMKYGLLLGGKRVRPSWSMPLARCWASRANCWMALPPQWSAFTHTPSCTTTCPPWTTTTCVVVSSTVHKAFDEGTAILAGDALQTLAFSILADHPMPGYIDGQPGADAECPGPRVRLSRHVRRSGTGSGRRRTPDQPRRAGAGAPPQDRGPSSSAP